MKIQNELWYQKLTGVIEEMYPSLRTITGSSTDPEIEVDGRRVLLFCSPNYLGLSNDPRVNNSFKNAVDKYGAGSNGSGIVSGYTDQHKRVEERFASFTKEESAIFFNAVSDATTGVITSVVGPPLRSLCPGLADDLGGVAVFYDAHNHASLLDAIKLAQPDRAFPYRHCSSEDLKRWLKRSNHRRKLIVTDGYFSMSAKIAPLPEICHLADAYGASVLVDDAHATGILGETGRGTLEHFGIENDVCLKAHSTGKAFGVRGGVVTGNRTFIRYLRVSARRYVFSGTLPASVPAAVITAMDIAEQEPWRRERVLAHAEYLRAGLKAMGCSVLGEKHIVPWFIGNDDKANAISQVLEEQGVFASSIRYPAVAKGKALVRFIPMATHTIEHLDRVLLACERAGKHL